MATAAPPVRVVAQLLKLVKVAVVVGRHQDCSQAVVAVMAVLVQPRHHSAAAAAAAAPALMPVRVLVGQATEAALVSLL